MYDDNCIKMINSSFQINLRNMSSLGLLTVFNPFHLKILPLPKNTLPYEIRIIFDIFDDASFKSLDQTKTERVSL